ncbi:MAG: M56 family metallopeptidase [Clostridia bacterium]|nr:M56 family metallopeptidase [Clostridia bacterium]
MTDFLLKLLNMSLVSSLLILALLILRPLMKKAPRAIMCALWGLVGLRLICPFSFESSLSLVPTSEPISKEAVTTAVEPEALSEVLDTQRIIISNTLASPAGASINPMQAISLVAAFIWAVGVAVMLIISLVSFLRLKKSVSASINVERNVYINDELSSPFVLGLFAPRIYIPSFLTEYEKEYVIAHENAHIKRCDYLFKPLGYIILSLHWFNPLVWVAYIMLCRDIEAACDELVIRKMDDQGKKEYSKVLLNLSVPSKKIRACPVAFGEVGVKARIKGVLSYKRPAFWIIVGAVLLTGVLSVCFLTNPVKAENEPEASKVYTLDERISKAIVDHSQSAQADSRFCVENYVELKSLVFGDNVTAYIWAYYGEYEKAEDTVNLCFEKYAPAKVRLRKVNDSYHLVEYKASLDRKDKQWVLENFPSELHNSGGFTPGYYIDQKNSAFNIAIEHFGANKKLNEFLPVFNAEVLEISEKYITVAPLKGETVSKNTFDKVNLSKWHLSDESLEVAAGDLVRVRYADIITLATDPPTLSNVYNIEVLAENVTLPLAIYSDGHVAYYTNYYAYEKVYIYDEEGESKIFPDKYFTLNEETSSFMLKFPTTSGNLSEYILLSGIYTEENDELILNVDFHEDKLYFKKIGTSYIFDLEKSREFSRFGQLGYLPFGDGARFILGQGVATNLN